VAPGDPHLAVGSGAIDFPGAVDIATVPGDLDLDPRPAGAGRDAGCDERITCTLPATATSFFTVTPCRLVDTRGTVGPRGGPALVSGATRAFVLASACGVPASARALSLNFTVTRSTGAGHLRFGPGGCPLPNTTGIQFGAGQTRANNAVLALSPAGDGTLLVWAQVAGGGSVDLIVDVNGYFE